MFLQNFDTPKKFYFEFHRFFLSLASFLGFFGKFKYILSIPLLKMVNTSLDHIIDPEINHVTGTYNAIIQYITTVPLKTIIEIGASSGGGTTEAVIMGVLRKNTSNITFNTIEVSRARFNNLKQRYQMFKWVTPWNVSSLNISDFPSDDEIKSFINERNDPYYPSSLTTVLQWKKNDIEYIQDNNIPQDGIKAIKTYMNVDHFDLAVIDGSEFLGNKEYEHLLNCDAYLLDDIYTYKNHLSYNSLLNNPNYKLLYREDTRGGSALFCKNQIFDTYFSDHAKNLLHCS
jgi:hypothetical protein